MVPLAEAWASGASEWTAAQRQAFANDLVRPQLFAVTDNVNQSKSDKDPAEWMPPREFPPCRLPNLETRARGKGRRESAFADPRLDLSRACFSRVVLVSLRPLPLFPTHSH